MKYSILNIGLLYMLTFILASSCSSFDDAADAINAEEITLTIKGKSIVPGIESLEGLSIFLEDTKFGFKKEATFSSNGEATISGITSGIYNIKITGKLAAANQDIYQMSIRSSGVNNYFLSPENNKLEFDIDGLRSSPLIFKEIFFAGTKPFYFRNQFYEIYNNSSDQVIYLDGIYFGHLTPATATDKLPVWPAEDGTKYAYAERVWKFPGNGTDYPLNPGESCVLAQFAANHKLPQYNPDSPVDCSTAEFEFNMDNPNFPDQPATDMVHVFYDGRPEKGSIPQYMTSVFGGAFVMFKPLYGEEYDPVNDLSMQTKDLSSKYDTKYAKVPLEYVIDAVEAGHNESKLNAKRVPSVLDAGMTYVGASYNSLGVTRKKIGENTDGTPILQDDNNSTDDFERGVVPMFRRYNSKMPSWNHTLSGKKK